MTQVPPSPMIPIDDEKSPRLGETGDDTRRETSITEGENVSSDGDDALKLVGTHAHQFDEKYYLRLRRKIVSSLEWSPTDMAHGFMD